jgi:tripartite-type tricarboxylate transporter receptor subunit TctC
MTIFRTIVAIAALAATAGEASADTATDYFKGKQVNIMVAYSTGGYDLYARLIAQFLSRHLPGQPTVIVQNMPGAGGLKAARYLLDIAPKDGTTLGVLGQTIPFDTVTGYSDGFDAGKLHWVGRIGMNVEVGVANKQSGIRSFDDLRSKVVSVGGTGGTGSSTVMPYLLSRLAGAKVKLVSGYRSANEAMLATQRGEVDMVGAFGLSSIAARFAHLLADGSIVPIYLTALGRDPHFPLVPTIGELASNSEDRQILELFASGSAIGRSLVAPPGVPQNRLLALRQAMAAAMSDPALLAFAAERNVPLEPGSAEEIESIVRKILATPQPIAQRATAILESLKASR